MELFNQGGIPTARHVAWKAWTKKTLVKNVSKLLENRQKFCESKQIMYCKREHFEIFTPWYKMIMFKTYATPKKGPSTELIHRVEQVKGM